MMPSTVKSGASYKGPKVIGIWILGENVTDRQIAIGEAYMTFKPQHPDPYQIMTDSARIFFIIYSPPVGYKIENVFKKEPKYQFCG
jgi:hypothetical protein